MRPLVAAFAAVLALGVPGQIQTSTAPAGDLDTLFAPIALYPDALLGPILVSAGNPAMVGALSEWLRSRETLKGSALQDAARASNFGDSYVALVLFPEVVQSMAEQLAWTTKVGQAFTGDRPGVFASIQRLRTKAKNAGKLTSNEQQSVTTETTAAGQEVIVIAPANPQLVYLPRYNAQTVYVPSTVVIKEDDDSDAAVAAGLIGFTAGIALGAAIHDDYYYGPYGWGGGFRMYDDDWDDWYDHREDARDDWRDHREDIVEERGDRARDAQDQRTNRAEGRSDAANARPRERAATGTEQTAATTERTSAATRGHSRDAASASSQRSGTRSDAFSGYANGRSERAASSRGASSRSSSRGGGRRR